MVRPSHRDLCRTANAREMMSERILDERKSTFPYTDEQAQQQFMQVYHDLKIM